MFAIALLVEPTHSLVLSLLLGMEPSFLLELRMIRILIVFSKLFTGELISLRIVLLLLIVSVSLLMVRIALLLFELSPPALDFHLIGRGRIA